MDKIKLYSSHDEKSFSADGMISVIKKYFSAIPKHAENEWNGDNAFYWRMHLRDQRVPADLEEDAAQYYHARDYGTWPLQ